MELVMKLKFNPLTPKISLINSPYLLPHSSCDVCLENLVLDELRIPLLIFFSHYLSAKYCIDIVKRTSVLVTHKS